MANNQPKSNKNGTRQKADWFEALCTMGEEQPTPKKSTSTRGGSKSTSAGRSKSAATTRRRVQNRSDDPFDDRPPFDDTDIPPFDANEESVAETVFAKDNKKSGTSAAKGSRSSAGSSRSTSQRSSRSSAKSGGKQSTGGNRTRGGQAAQPEERSVADIVYFLQPYAVCAVGALLAIEMLLSLILSGGAYGWTRDTQPFRWFGYYLEYLLFGLFGYGAYLIPPMMIYLSVDRLRHGQRRTGKGLMAGGIVLLLPAIVHVCLLNAGVAGVPDSLRMGELYNAGAAHLGAGVLPGFFAYTFNVGLGVIGTLIVGGFLLILMSLLLVGLTPAMLWERLREARQNRREQKELAESREMEMRQERGLVVRDAAPRKGSTPEQRAADDMERRIQRKLDREQEKMEQEALREAERSDRIERAKATKKSGGKSRASEPQESEFDPIDALLQRERTAADEDAPKVKEKKQPKEKKAAKQAAPAVVRSEDVQPFEDVDEPMEGGEVDAVFEDVVDLPVEEDPAFAKKKVKKRRAQEMPVEEEKPAEDELQTYPAQTEIELDMDAPMPEDDEITELFTGSAAKTAAPAQEAQVMPADLSEIYEDLGDTDAEAPDEDDNTELVQADGGVTIAVEKLSDEERARGAVIVTPEQKQEYARVRPYTFPKVDMLMPEPEDGGVTEALLQQKAIRLRDTLNSFNVRVEGVTYVGGPTVTRYEVKPAPGVKVASITRLSDDIAMGLEASGAVRIEAPIPGKNAVGIEVPNDKRSTVYLRGLIDCETFRTAKSRVTCCLGKGVGGVSVYLNIEKMPHLLIAGATGTGKSVCINSLIMSLLYKAKPDEVKLLMIDPKTVEFSVYKDIPHLMAPIICDSKRAAGALNLAVQEMERRYELMRTVGVRNISGYNTVTENDRYEHPYIPQMVIIIDELADLMMTAKNEVEASIVRLAQKARAAGIHLILGTQRPSVDVITGLIKANVPSRISFTVTSQVDSRTILDNAGAEKLLGIGDMLYAPIGSSKPQRVQGCFVSDDEVEKIVDFIRRNNDEVRYDQNFLDNLDREAELIGSKRDRNDDYGDEDGEAGDLDPKFYEALGIAVKNKRISTSLLQRAISIGYGRAAKILDQMEDKGFIGPASGNKPREILISEEAYRELMMNQD